jgi:ASC-1-like (ASCH) protein
MTIHRLPFSDPDGCPLFQYIKEGIKTVEGRKNSPKYHDIHKGDYIIFTHDITHEDLLVRAYIHKYVDIEDYLKKETLRKTLPCVRTYKDGIAIYNIFTTSKERNKLYELYGAGFLAIGIEVVMEDFAELP